MATAIAVMGAAAALLSPMVAPAGAAVSAPVLTPTAAFVPLGDTIVVNGTGCIGTNHAAVSYIADIGTPLENVVHLDNPITVAANGTFQSTLLLDPNFQGLHTGEVLTIIGVCGFFSDQPPLPRSTPVTVTIGPVPPTTTTTHPATTTTVKPTAAPPAPVKAKAVFTG